MNISDYYIITKNKQDEFKIDFVMNMANFIAGQILNNENCKNEYARILAIASLKIDEALRIENDNK